MDGDRLRRSGRRWRPAKLILATAAVVAGGCSGYDSVLSPASPSAGRVATLGWILIVAATAVTVGVFAYLAYGLLRRRRDTPQGRSGEVRGASERWIIGGGIVLPVVVIGPIAAFSVTILDDPPPPAAVEVEVIAHRYWWEYRYPEPGFETANELHIPVGQPVELSLRSDDVVHSLWVPALGGKTDLVPGRVNTMILEADEAGTYQGRCAEYCGLQHAKMLFEVVAEAPDDYRRWVEGQQAAAGVPPPAVMEGEELFDRQGCASCHTVRGSEADGVLGPDLTHIASRRTLGAGVLENTPANLRRWIGETWEVKSGITMPPLPLSGQEVDALARYLETLE